MSWETTLKVFEYIEWMRITSMIGYFVMWAAGFTAGWWICRSRFDHVAGNVYKKHVKKPKPVREDPVGDYSNGIHIMP